MLDKYVKETRKNFKFAIVIGIIFLLVSAILFVVKINQIALFFLIAGLTITITEIISALNFNDIYRAMSESEKEYIESELNKTILISKNHYTITENGIFIPQKLFFIHYKDIILIYERPKLNRNSLEVYINIITKDNKRFCLPTYTTNITIGVEYHVLKEIIIKKNPNVLIGKNNKNKEIIKEKYNIEL